MFGGFAQKCGRFSLAYQKTDREYDEYFKAIMQAQKKAKPRYNIAPTQTSPIIRVRDGEPVCEEVRWGLYENWWTDVLEIEGIRTNARSEKAFNGGLFKNSARKWRCVVLATGWYEWKAVTGRKTSDPFTFGMKDYSIMMFAGIWTSKLLDKEVYEDNFAIIPYKGRDLMAYQVGPTVNSVKNAGKECLEPFEA